jgi:L-fuconate dehydratase
MAPIVEGKTLKEIFENFGELWRALANHHQLRWVGPEKGVSHLAIAGIINALWDLWGKLENKPVWRLLLDLTPEQLVNCLDFRYVTDFITKEEAIAILKKNWSTRGDRIKEIEKVGFPGYTTGVGWSGYSNDHVRNLVEKAKAQGFKHFKVKVGLGLEKDDKKLKFMRELIGKDAIMMTDAN